MALALSLNPDAAVADAAAAYSDTGVCALDAALATPSARRLLKAAEASTLWNRVALIAGAHRDFDAAEMDRLDAARRGQFEAQVNAGARAGFQYLYDTIALYDAGRAGRLDDPVLRAAYDLTRSQAFLALGRALTGDKSIRFADSQITRFGPGHFLTRHDDAVEGKNRIAAYVLNLTQDWTSDFGGVLHLLDEAGDVRRGFTPAFNRLTLFGVPQPHAVSVVAPFAPAPRFAVTGWFRAGEEPAP